MPDEKLTADAIVATLPPEFRQNTHALINQQLAQSQAEHEREVEELNSRISELADANTAIMNRVDSLKLQLRDRSSELADLKREHEEVLKERGEFVVKYHQGKQRIAELEQQVIKLQSRESAAVSEGMRAGAAELALTQELSDRFDVGKNGVHKVSVMAYDKAGKLLYQDELEQFDAELAKGRE